MAGTQAVSLNLGTPGTASAKVTQQDKALDFGSCMTQQTDKVTGKTPDRSKTVQNTGKKDMNLNTGAARIKQSQDVQSDTAKQAMSETGVQGDMADTAQSTLDQADQAVRDLLQDVLQISDEVISTVMSQMQIQPVQLMEPAVLQEFVVQFNGKTDSTAFLTDAAMVTQLEEITDGLQDIAGRMNLTADDFLQLIQEQLEPVVSENAVESAADMVSEIQHGMVRQPETLPQAVQTMQAAVGETVNEPEEQATGTIAQPDAGSGQTEETETVQHTVIQAQPEADAQNTAQDFTSGESSDQSSSQSQMTNGTAARETAEQVQPMLVTDFAEQLVQASGAEAASETNMQQMVDIVNQVVERIHTHVQEDTTTMQLQLNPESLGKVLLSVSNKNGVMTASFTVQTNEAREALENQMFVLRENLEQKNLKVESVEVSVSDFDFSQNSQMDAQDQKGYEQGNGRRAPMQFEEAEDDTEDVAQPVTAQDSAMQMSGTSIDYTA